MNNTFYAVPTRELRESCLPVRRVCNADRRRMQTSVRLGTELENKNEKDKIMKFTQIIGSVIDEVKNCLMQIQLSADILERKLYNVDYLVSKEEIEYINTGVNLLNKTMENLHYLSPVVPDFQKMDMEEVLERMVSLYSSFEEENSLPIGYYEKIDKERDESENGNMAKGQRSKEIKVEEFMQRLFIQIVGEAKNCLTQIQLSADILERKLSNLNGTFSKEDYIKNINSSVGLLDETMESLLYYARPV